MSPCFHRPWRCTAALGAPCGHHPPSHADAAAVSGEVFAQAGVERRGADPPADLSVGDPGPGPGRPQAGGAPCTLHLQVRGPGRSRGPGAGRRRGDWPWFSPPVWTVRRAVPSGQNSTSPMARACPSAPLWWPEGFTSQQGRPSPSPWAGPLAGQTPPAWHPRCRRRGVPNNPSTRRKLWKNADTLDAEGTRARRLAPYLRSGGLWNNSRQRPRRRQPDPGAGSGTRSGHTAEPTTARGRTCRNVFCRMLKEADVFSGVCWHSENDRQKEGSACH